MKHDIIELKRIIRNIIEEGKGSSSSLMDRRNAQNKFKSRHRYSKPELQALDINELDAIAAELGVSTISSAHEDFDEKELEIQAILEGQD